MPKEIMLFDRTRKRKVVSRVSHCKTAWSKFAGLMLSLPIRDKCLVFHFDPPRKVDLHMLFVFFPIDVLFLDKKLKVVEIKENFMPFTFYMSRKKASYTIELPAHTVLAKRIRVGDRLGF